MKKLLIVLLNLVFSVTLFAAEPMVAPDGRKGIFFEREEAEKLLIKVEELPSLQKEVELLRKEIGLKNEIENILNKKVQAEKEISEKYQQNFEKSQEIVARYQSKDDIQTYINIGLFTIGTIVGGGIMYGASLLIANTLKE